MARLNHGGAMNWATGVFTAPVSGRYFFSFTARSNTDRDPSWVHLRVNGFVYGTSYVPNKKWYNMPLSVALHLNSGDRVDMWLGSGSIYDSQYMNTHFSGMLLDEDLIVL